MVVEQHGGRGLLPHDCRTLLSQGMEARRPSVPGFGLLAEHKFIQFLVEVFLVFDRLDEAVLDFNEAILLDREAADLHAILITFRVKHGRELVSVGLILLLCAVLLENLLKFCLCPIESDLADLDLGNFVSFD